MDEMDEVELIQKSQQGNLEAFNKLIGKYQIEICNLSFRMLSNVSAAEDASQEALFLAWKNIGNLKHGNFKAWLLRITANVCRDQLRRKKRQSKFILDSSFLDSLQNASNSSIENEFLNQELADEIQRGLDRLPYEQRLSIILHDVLGLKYQEVSEIMGCSLGTVRSRLSRGRLLLRDYLANRGYLRSSNLKNSINGDVNG
jgi:RNA polymerase sigma-70 factor (ECF subfamily)